MNLLLSDFRPLASSLDTHRAQEFTVYREPVIKMVGSTLTALVLGTALVKAGTNSHDAIRRHADLAKKQEGSQGYMSVGYYVSPDPRSSSESLSIIS
jgi:hypothetical protein